MMVKPESRANCSVKVVVDESFNSNVDPEGDEVMYEDEDERLPSFHLAVSDIHEIEIKKLRIRKYIMHVVMGMCALAIIFWYSYYYTIACSKVSYYTTDM